jgi:hypothetical protein
VCCSAPPAVANEPITGQSRQHAGPLETRHTPPGGHGRRPAQRLAQPSYFGFKDVDPLGLLGDGNVGVEQLADELDEKSRASLAVAMEGSFPESDGYERRPPVGGRLSLRVQLALRR